MPPRFTIDGADELEHFLSALCQEVRDGVLSIAGASRLEALVLGGGYGRGQGGVLHSPEGDKPYNDLEFYVFLKGNRLLNRRRFSSHLNSLGDRLSANAGLHVEFKVESLDWFRRSPITMFSYDLVAGHRLVFGKSGALDGCQHHLRPENIPLSEATRLLFNRCTGLLLARELLVSTAMLQRDDIDFISRNIAKAQLALGDALLTVHRQYHWDVQERHRRLRALPHGSYPGLPQIVQHHAAGRAFKLHPVLLVGLFPSNPRSASRDLFQTFPEVSTLARDLWLWIESRRLQTSFKSPADYSRSNIPKWNDSPGWLNFILNLRTFGLKAALDPVAGRYPRERLLTALPVLLWEESDQSAKNLQVLLHARAPDWPNLVAAYKQVWPSYG